MDVCKKCPYLSQCKEDLEYPCFLLHRMMLSAGNGSVDQMADQPFRVVVEIVTPEVVTRLEAENATLRQEVTQLRQQHNSLHATVYQLMDRLAHLNRSVKDKG